MMLCSAMEMKKRKKTHVQKTPINHCYILSIEAYIYFCNNMEEACKQKDL